LICQRAAATLPLIFFARLIQRADAPPQIRVLISRAAAAADAALSAAA